MPREVVALVSADDVVAAVRVYADRVHDLLRRSGCGPAESVEVAESYAFALLDALVNAPETVGDMAGWWFGRVLELGRRLGTTGAEPAGEQPSSVLAGTSGEEQVRAALASLPDGERAAVILRDAYDLPPEAVAVALRRDVDTAAGLVAVGRLHLVARYDDRRIPDLSGHTGRTQVDLATLGRLADGSLPPPRAVPVRRHVPTCPACDGVVEVLAKGRRLAAGLPVLAMPDDAREAMIERVAARAVTVLPSVEDVLLIVEADEDRGPSVSPVTVILALVLALVLGIAVAAVTRSDTGNGTLSEPSTAPSVTPSFPVASTSAKPKHTPRPHRSSASASPTPTATTPSPTRTATPTHTATTTAPPAAATVSVDPTSGPRGTQISVTGAGWTPGEIVSVTYSGTLTSSSATATVNKHGGFQTTLTANGTLPGRYTVTADDGTTSEQTSFTQTT